ncbi:acyl-CoA dehydrogenase family protein [Drepanopeziza brunnea f. sp. 'multigermtubi' MB_m1]|uniref:Acyl-CoA dehydrogenase family protein n=1 Tax=Marssonina brunnea f. sp. multigermtubi (strain MB_m1) TaxID=1072389 RepID=K1WVK0_MARBU|nr:acyl-CoA dehydrogenase family protein [Drepanopeziza brunnea f. sp. 'multigermtubi' MB_m1]EKD12673.1 acyl-CoA dehydrogenase family protein [Drepanopeziza brunnea f. sp. 'multigermtubi' MB_m1]
MPTDHTTLSFTDVFLPDSAILGKEGYGLALGHTFVRENRLRQAASSLGAAASIRASKLSTQVELLRLLIL